MVAAANLVQRGLRTLTDQVKQLKSEGDKEAREGQAPAGGGAGAAVQGGRSARARGSRGKRGLGGALGLGSSLYVDAFEEEEDLRERKRRARHLLGDDEEPVFIIKTGEHRDLNATVAPEFRAQVAAGLARANTLTAGSTLVDPGGGGDASESW